jgi:arginine-tRNA-protein transferase
MTVQEPDKQFPPGIDEKLEQYFVDISASCPYGIPEMATFHQALFSHLDDHTMRVFLDNGFRRNGNCMYSMLCENCQGCVPIRLEPVQFRANRNQKRVWKKNRDVDVEVAPLTMSDENLSLLDRFLTTRFPDGNATAESYYSGFFYTAITGCFEIRYRVNDKLLGVAVVDCSSQWMNAVYFYFDPDQAARSPGTMNILQLVKFCSRYDIKPLYLGYWIEEIQAMTYKSAFKPHELLLDGQWQRVERR